MIIEKFPAPYLIKAFRKGSRNPEQFIACEPLRVDIREVSERHYETALKHNSDIFCVLDGQLYRNVGKKYSDFLSTDTVNYNSLLYHFDKPLSAIELAPPQSLHIDRGDFPYTTPLYQDRDSHISLREIIASDKDVRVNAAHMVTSELFVTTDGDVFSPCAEPVLQLSYLPQPYSLDPLLQLKICTRPAPFSSHSPAIYFPITAYDAAVSTAQCIIENKLLHDEYNIGPVALSDKAINVNNDVSTRYRFNLDPQSSRCDDLNLREIFMNCYTTQSRIPHQILHARNVLTGLCHLAMATGAEEHINTAINSTIELSSHFPEDYKNDNSLQQLCVLNAIRNKYMAELHPDLIHPGLKNPPILFDFEMEEVSCLTYL